jgi:hypothetical protein
VGREATSEPAHRRQEVGRVDLEDHLALARHPGDAEHRRLAHRRGEPRDVRARPLDQRPVGVGGAGEADELGTEHPLPVGKGLGEAGVRERRE